MKNKFLLFYNFIFLNLQTARDEEAGKKAVAELATEGLTAHFHQLDIDNLDSIKAFAAYIKNKYNGLDILVNNAAIAYKV